MDEHPGRPDPSFEERLRRARERSGLEPPPVQKGGPNWANRPLALGFTVATEMVAAMVVAVAIGWSLDRWLGTRPWLLLLFVVLGVVAGTMNVWRLVKPRDQDKP
ncbi:MAG: AtpZ/AtpI family protein [Stellaceae bacterium]